MARLILKAPYYKSKGKVNRGGYAKYIATRDGVEILRSGMADYINERKGSNGLFSDEGVVINLSQIEETMNNHSGNMWGLIFSLRREDAERLGYNSAEQWMNLLRSRRNDIAKEMHISPGNLRWYAAYHNSETHPHVHMLVWSDKPGEPYLSTTGIHNIKSTIAKDIFRQQLYSIYKEQTQVRDNIKVEFRNRMSEIVEALRSSCPNISEEFVLKFEMLTKKLAKHKGKKQYGYLDKSAKSLVDDIVKIVASNENIVELYELWHKYRCETFKTYTDTMPEKIPLEDNKEFKSIRNLVVQMAAEFKLDEQFVDHGEQEEQNQNEYEDIERLEKQANRGDSRAMYFLGKKYLGELDDPDEAEYWLQQSADRGNEYAMYFLYKSYRDGLFSGSDELKMYYLELAVEKQYAPAEYEYGKLLGEKNPEMAMKYFQSASFHGSDYGTYAYGKMLLEQGKERKAKLLIMSSAINNPVLKMCAGLTLCYQFDDFKLGKEYLQKSAEQGYAPAAEVLNSIERGLDARIAMGILNLFYYASRIIDSRANENTRSGLVKGIDRKRLNELRMKKEGQGMRMSMW